MKTLHSRIDSRGLIWLVEDARFGVHTVLNEIGIKPTEVREKCYSDIRQFGFLAS